jgi:predicted RNA-binding Zn-ribbon protein involved in translation (DUF1610 family)
MVAFDVPRTHANCGTKLNMLNTHLKYRKKCYPCGQKEFARYKEERDGARAAPAQQQPAQQPAKDFTQQQATKSMAVKNCEDCGVKLTVLNRNWKYKDRCHSCAHLEFVRVAQEREKAKPKKIIVKVTYLTYLGGFAGVTEHQRVDMHFGATQLTVKTTFGAEMPLWAMPYDKIKGIHIDTAEHLTAARLLFTGILAFGLKKETRYLVVSFEDAHGLMHNPVFEGGGIDAAQQAIYQWIEKTGVQPQTPQAASQPQKPQTAPIDVTEQIKKLGELRDQGLLTEQEFDSKKQELLARM